MSKTVEARVSISTNPQVAGRYFIDVRDTTNGANRQMTTQVTDAPADFIAKLTAAAERAGVLVVKVDQTGGY